MFSLAHLVQDATRLIEAGYDKPPYYINMVLNAVGFQGGYPYSPKIVQLFVDHLQLGAQTFQTRRHVRKTPLDQPTRHGTESVKR